MAAIATAAAFHPAVQDSDGMISASSSARYIAALCGVTPFSRRGAPHALCILRSSAARRVHLCPVPEKTFSERRIIPVNRCQAAQCSCRSRREAAAREATPGSMPRRASRPPEQTHGSSNAGRRPASTHHGLLPKPSGYASRRVAERAMDQASVEPASGEPQAGAARARGRGTRPHIRASGVDGPMGPSHLPFAPRVSAAGRSRMSRRSG